MSQNPGPHGDPQQGGQWGQQPQHGQQPQPGQWGQPAPYGQDPSQGGWATQGQPTPYGQNQPQYGQGQPQANWGPPLGGPQGYNAAGGVPTYHDPGAVPTWQGYDNPYGAMETASAGARLGARLLDGLFCWLPLMILFQALFGQKSPAVTLFTAMGMVLYMGFFISQQGTTPGKKICGLKVINAQTGQNVSLGQAAGREAIFIVSSWLCLVGCFSLFFDQSGLMQAWHDKAASSRVVKG